MKYSSNRELNKIIIIQVKIDCMTKEEIIGFIDTRFKKIGKHFRTTLDRFEPKDSLKFRSEMKKLKVFFHLLNMESSDGFSYRITKRMKTIYGYLGIIQNFQLQLKKTNEYVKESLNNIPVSYVSMLEKELDYWKKLSKDFIDPSYDFSNDERDILATLPDKLSSKSIKKFIDYTLYELKTMSGRLDEDEALDNARKYIEDLYYNYSFISPFITQQQANLLNGRSMEESLKLFGDLRDRNVALALLKFCASEELDESEKKLLKEMENEWMNEKKVLKNKLIATLEAMNIKTNHLKGFVLQK